MKIGSYRSFIQKGEYWDAKHNTPTHSFHPNSPTTCTKAFFDNTFVSYNYNINSMSRL